MTRSEFVVINVLFVSAIAIAVGVVMQQRMGREIPRSAAAIVIAFVGVAAIVGIVSTIAPPGPSTVLAVLAMAWIAVRFGRTRMQFSDARNATRYLIAAAIVALFVAVVLVLASGH